MAKIWAILIYGLFADKLRILTELSLLYYSIVWGARMAEIWGTLIY